MSDLHDSRFQDKSFTDNEYDDYDPKYSDSYIVELTDPDYKTVWINIENDLNWITRSTESYIIKNMVNCIFLDLHKTINKKAVPLHLVKIERKLDECTKIANKIAELIQIRDNVIEDVVTIHGREFDHEVFNIMIRHLLLHNILLLQEISYSMITEVSFYNKKQLDRYLNSHYRYKTLFDKKIRNPIAHGSYNYYDEPVNDLQFLIFEKTSDYTTKYVSQDIYDLYMRMRYLHIAAFSILRKIRSYKPNYPISHEHPLEARLDKIYYKNEDSDIFTM